MWRVSHDSRNFHRPNEPVSATAHMHHNTHTNQPRFLIAFNSQRVFLGTSSTHLKSSDAGSHSTVHTLKRHLISEPQTTRHLALCILHYQCTVKFCIIMLAMSNNGLVSACLPACLSICLSVCLSVCSSVLACVYSK